MRSHIHVSATYLKHFSFDPSKGRKSIVQVFNKKTQTVQDLPVDKIGIRIGAFSDGMENFHKMFEDRYNEFMDLMKIRFPIDTIIERLKNGMMLVFNYIFRSKIMYDYMKESLRNYPDIIREYGDNPWHSPEILSKVFFELLLKRAYPIIIQVFLDDVFITSDNPVVMFRHPYGFVTLYLLPLDRKHIFCLGYYLKKEQLRFIDIYFKNVEIIPENVNLWERKQAETHYII